MAMMISKKTMLVILLACSACSFLQATFNGFDMSQDMPIDGLPLIPERIYFPSGNETRLLKQRHAYCRHGRPFTKRSKLCRRHRQPSCNAVDPQLLAGKMCGPTN
jgi:hypothetical protein